MSDDGWAASASTGLSDQADEIIGPVTDWTVLAEQLDVSRYRYQDGHPEWHDGTPFRPMFLAYLWTHVEQQPPPSIPTRLDDNPELAEAFGFDPNNLTSKITCRLSRPNDRFDDLRSTVKLSAEQIRKMGAERGAPIGYNLGISSTDGDEDSSPSNRTIQRLLRKKGREVLTELKTTAIPSISVPRPDDPVYNESELLVVEAIAAIEQLGQI